MATQDLCSLSDVRAFLELPTSDTSRDSLISNTITPISDAIMRFTQREFAPATTSAARVFRFDVGSLLVDLAPYDLRTVSSVVLHAETSSPLTLTASSQYQLHPITARDAVYTSVRLASNIATMYQSDSGRFFGYAQMTITGAWGFASVPSDVKQAAIISVASAVRRDIHELDIGNSLSDPRQLTADMPISYALPGPALRLVGPYRRVGMQ